MMNMSESWWLVRISMELMWNGLRSFQTETKEVGFGDMISSIQETRIVFDTVKCVTFVTN
jgi:hypothetical protein